MCVYLHCRVVHVFTYETKRRYAFRSYLYNYFYSCILFFQSERITKKIVKVTEVDIYGKLFEIYKGNWKRSCKMNSWMPFYLAFLVVKTLPVIEVAPFS